MRDNYLGTFAAVAAAAAFVFIVVYLIVKRKKAKAVPIVIGGLLLIAGALVLWLQFRPFSVDISRVEGEVRFTVYSDDRMINRGTLTGEEAESVKEMLSGLTYRRESPGPAYQFPSIEIQMYGEPYSMCYFNLYPNTPERSVFGSFDFRYTVIGAEDVIDDLLAIFENSGLAA